MGAFDHSILWHDIWQIFSLAVDFGETVSWFKVAGA
jgi:hypothetical protein